MENCLFTTLTNVNFDADVHVSLLRESQQIKEKLREVVGEIKNHTLHATYNLPETKSEMLKDAPLAGIMYEKSLDPDIRSLRQTIVYGLKGISAYGHQLVNSAISAIRLTIFTSLHLRRQRMIRSRLRSLSE